MWKNFVSHCSASVKHPEDQLKVASLEFCVLASVNKQVFDLSEELARKVEDSLRQQEEISSLLAQIVDLQARCKMVRVTYTKRTH